MKKLIFCFFLILNYCVGFSQENLPNVILKDINGKSLNFSELSKEKNPIIINFWATWCAPCKRELNCINEIYPDWVEEFGVKLYAISIDDQRTVDRVKPYVLANDWQYEIFLDTNGDLKRAMGVNNVPFTVLLVNGKILWKHNNYNPGDEDELYNKLKESTEKNEGEN